MSWEKPNLGSEDHPARAGAVQTEQGFNMGPSGGILSGAVWASDGNIYPSVQSAVDAVEADDSINNLVIVGEGRFDESVRLSSDYWTLVGQGRATIIDGGDSPAVTMGVNGGQNQVIRNFNVTCDQSGNAAAAVYTHPDAQSMSGNEYEVHNVFVHEEGSTADRGATVGFDLTNGVLKKMSNCTSNYTTGDGFITESTKLVNCHADIRCDGRGFTAKNRSFLFGCEATDPQGNEAFNLATSFAFGCQATGSSVNFGHYAVRSGSVAIGCKSANATADFVFDMPEPGGYVSASEIENASTTVYRLRGSDNRVYPASKVETTGSLIDASAATRPRYGGLIGGGPIGGVDISAVTGASDGDRARTTGASAAPADVTAIYDGSEWIYPTRGGSVTPS